ncbi:RNA-directed DNA polymerase, eukaryota, partial [Tanacetum coccineum]
MASESSFSIGRRVLDPYRTSLSSQLVETLFCTQDWIRRERMERNVDGIEDLSIDYEVVKEMKETLTESKMNFTHFKKQFSPIQAPSICFDFTFPTRLSSDQVQDLERPVTYEEVKMAVWDCGTNKSPGRDGFSFEFY